MAPLQAKPIGPARCTLFGRDRRRSHIHCEAKFGSQLVKTLREIISKKGANALKIHWEFIGHYYYVATVTWRRNHVKVQDRYLASF